MSEGGKRVLVFGAPEHIVTSRRRFRNPASKEPSADVRQVAAIARDDDNAGDDKNIFFLFELIPDLMNIHS